MEVVKINDLRTGDIVMLHFKTLSSPPRKHLITQRFIDKIAVLDHEVRECLLEALQPLSITVND